MGHLKPFLLFNIHLDFSCSTAGGDFQLGFGLIEMEV